MKEDTFAELIERAWKEDAPYVVGVLDNVTGKFHVISHDMDKSDAKQALHAALRSNMLAVA